MKRVRVLVADDSALMRQTLKRIIDGVPELEVAGLARDGEDAVAKARDLHPDVITMDINMPKLDGISALQMVLAEQICPVVMVSSLTQRGAVTTFECLELGAFDFVAKPEGTVSSNMGTVAVDLVGKIKAAAAAGLRRRAPGAARPVGWPRPVTLAKSPPKAAALPARRVVDEPLAVAIGISTGGPATLMDVLPLLPGDLPASVFLVQHMPASFLAAFAKRLDENCALRVVEAETGMVVEPGVCYVAPGALQLSLQQKANGQIVIRTPCTPETLFMPSVDVMMEAVLRVYGARTVGVLMTGIGDDGAAQMVAIRQAGGRTIAESAETAVVYGMPREAHERGGADVVVPSYEVAGEIQKAIGRLRTVAR